MGAIAAGRAVPVETVRKTYGRGSSMLAGSALESGLIDGIASRGSAARTLAYANGRATVGTSMANEASEPVAPTPALADEQAEPEATPEAKPEDAESEKSADEQAEPEATPEAKPAPVPVAGPASRSRRA
jgi:hypothetical protein